MIHSKKVQHPMYEQMHKVIPRSFLLLLRFI